MNESNSSIPSVTKTRRQKTQGTGSIHQRTIVKNNKSYQQAYYHYEIWKDGKRILKSSKYIPRNQEKIISELNTQKVPVKIILDLLSN